MCGTKYFFYFLDNKTISEFESLIYLSSTLHGKERKGKEGKNYQASPNPKPQELSILISLPELCEEPGLHT